MVPCERGGDACGGFAEGEGCCYGGVCGGRAGFGPPDVVGALADGDVVCGGGFVDYFCAGDVGGNGGGRCGGCEADGCDLGGAFGEGVSAGVFVDVGPGAVGALADVVVGALVFEVEDLGAGEG